MLERYTSESSDEDDDMHLNFSHRTLDTQSLFKEINNLLASKGEEEKAGNKVTLSINDNMLREIPENISNFFNLKKIDVSNNRITRVPEVLFRLPLNTLILRCNNLGDNLFPKSLQCLENSLEVLNLSGNNLTVFPDKIFRFKRLKYLYLGENYIKRIPSSICLLKRLEVLSLGGNRLREVPTSLCLLHELKAVMLSDNELEHLPACIANLKKLRTLQLHRNKLKTLPTEIVTLKYLEELSLRENPLVSKFVNDMIYFPPSLKEVSARVVKLHGIRYSPEDMPKNLFDFLQSAHHCVNPNCKGVYFNNRVEHVKFVDFCGKYRLPLLQYLCSSKCVDNSNKEELDSASGSNDKLMCKVLLG